MPTVLKATFDRFLLSSYVISSSNFYIISQLLIIFMNLIYNEQYIREYVTCAGYPINKK